MALQLWKLFEGSSSRCSFGSLYSPKVKKTKVQRPTATEIRVIMFIRMGWLVYKLPGAVLLFLKVPMYSRNVWYGGLTNDRLRHKQLAAA